ncbi:MAG: hypothetical protein RR946_09500 [Clostridia bacterium]
MADWKVIKSEYSAGGVGMKALAAKHGVGISTLYRRAAQEGWRVKEKVGALPKEGLREIGGELERIERILASGEALMRQLERATAELDRVAVKQTTRERELEYGDLDAKGKPTREVIRDTETLEVVSAPIDRAGLRQLAATLKDLSGVAQLKNGGGEELSGVERIMRRLDTESATDKEVTS